MHLESHVALSTPASIKLRFKLARLGINLESAEAKSLITLIDELGYQKMLTENPISVRYSAIKRKIPKERIWK
uniref:Uncharacterized protein n=1 Tax=Uncultured marine euryarchaeote TaxID=257466 RepID=A0A1B0Z1Y2_UNCAR|nr:hypothetical protein [uncultured marine euryarchaeote]